MRSWHPIPPSCLDSVHLNGEHRELHGVFAILTQDKRGYRHHPETARWEGHLEALCRRHDALVAEARRRGWPSGLDHQTPMVLDESHVADLLTEGAPSEPGTVESVGIMAGKLMRKLRAAKEWQRCHALSVWVMATDIDLTKGS